MNSQSEEQNLATDKDQIYQEYLALISAARAQLEFFQELGVSNFGSTQQASSSQVSAQKTPPAVVAPITLNQPVINVMPIISIETAKSQNQPAKLSLVDSLSTPDSLAPTADPTIRPRSVRIEMLNEIKAEAGHCCQLCDNAIKVVCGEGNPQAELMFIGEAPGADEDVTGRPFVGAAGQLLDKIIGAIGYKRADVYISNIVKCRPPENRKPTSQEIESCEPFLFREIEIVKPKVIVTLGATPLYSLLRVTTGITRARGNFYDYKDIPVMPTFHPAYLLRKPEFKREVWEDMKKVMARLQELK